MQEDSDFGTAPDGQSEDLGAANDTQTPDAGATTGDTEAQAGQEPSFTDLDPTHLPPELQAHFKSFQRSYTKRMQALSAKEREFSESAQLVQRFNTDPSFQEQIYRQLHQRYGRQEPRQDLNQAQATNGASGGPPAEFVASIRAKLPSELQWMAETQAEVAWASLEPLRHRIEAQEAERQRERESSFAQQAQAVEAEMDEHYPMWREDEATLREVQAFLSDPKALRHPKFGSKLALIYRGLKADTIGTANALTRMRTAANSRTTTGRPTAATQSNLEERIAGAKTNKEAFELAALAAAEDIKRGHRP